MALEEENNYKGTFSVERSYCFKIVVHKAAYEKYVETF